MRKFLVFAIVAMALTIFNGCQKSDEPVLIDAQPQVAVKPDVYVENGYLAFKNIEAVDSVIQLLSTMDSIAIESWEQQIDFKSARAAFNALFAEYDKLESYEAFIAFKKRNRGKLKFNEMDEDDCSIDYPFATTYFIPVLNKNGLVKIGRSLIKYTDTKHIVVRNGNINALNDIESQIHTGNIFIFPKLKAYYHDDDLIHDFPEDNPSGAYNSWYEKTSRRRLKNELRIDRYRFNWYDYDNNREVWTVGYKIIFKQQAQKRRNSRRRWKNYSTRYTFDDMKKQVGTGSVYEFDPYTPPVSSTVSPYAFIVIDEEKTYYYPINEYDIPPLLSKPLVSFSCETSCQGFDGILYPIDHPVHSGFTASSGAYWNPIPDY